MEFYEEDLWRNGSNPLHENGTQVTFIDRLFSNTSLAHRLLERLTFTNLRHTFYLISPYETTVHSIDDVPNYNIQVSVWWFVFIVVELLLLRLSNHDDRFALNDSITSICAGMLSQCFKLPLESPWTWILCLFFQDFMYYLGHRAVHEMGFFWGLHTIHHSSEYYNYTTALRQAAIQDAGLAFYDCLQAFFIPPPIFLVHRYFSEIFQFIMHTSLLGDMGPLGLVLNTPSHHRVHHGRNPYCIDKNFGGVFIIWDRLFGTFEAERKEDPPVYGLIHPENNFNQIWLQFHTLWDLLLFKGLAKDKTGKPIFPGLINKLKAALYPPGWVPGLPTVMFFHWKTLVDPAHGVPQPEKPVIRYNPQLELWIKLYLVFYFTLFLAIFYHFEYDRPTLSYADFTVKILFFVITMQCYGGFFDKRWWAPLAESGRCLGVIGYYGVLLWIDGGAGPHRVSVMCLHASAAAFWTGYGTQKWLQKRIAPEDSKTQITQTVTTIIPIPSIASNTPPPPYTK
ncbi:unnamed protein product, partial [Mesorhabditis belari]|uniref:Fatty acid hydroxylase domain-containing protein n=1 Tax=Mesorhabditis belari TaxID=2138241 RepID=A0AAF3E8B7_9BILA